jgi:hypothetical protein
MIKDNAGSKKAVKQDIAGTFRGVEIATQADFRGKIPRSLAVYGATSAVVSVGLGVGQYGQASQQLAWFSGIFRRKSGFSSTEGSRRGPWG